MSIFSYIYWADWGDQPKISRADLTGMNQETILDQTKVTWPSSIAVDHTLEKIFWADMNKRWICSSDINGDNVLEVVTELTSPYGITVFEDYVYWTDYRLKKLFKANKFNGLRKSTFGNYLTAPMDIAVYHPLVQTRGNNCVAFQMLNHVCLIYRIFLEIIFYHIFFS